MSEHAYRTTKPRHLAVHREAVAGREVFTARLHAAILQLGQGPLRPLQRRIGFGGPIVITGLEHVDDAHVPWGWRIITPKGKPEIVPLPRGAGSAAAQQWLKNNQPSAACDPLYMLKDHGITYQSRIHLGRGAYNTYYPALFEYADALWVWYRDGDPQGDFYGEPGTITWDRVSLGEMSFAYATAYEAATARIKETV